MDNIKLEILPSGHIKFKRGSKAHNKEMRKIISFIIDEDKDILKDIDDFFNGSADTELLIGDTIYCG